MTEPDLQTRTFLITGANSGIGRALAEALAARGGRVVLAARSAERTAPVVDDIRSRFPQSNASFLPLDLADLASVRRAAERFLASGQSLDVLVNNAGVAGNNSLSKDGFELTYAVNHIGPFLFTNLLLPKLREVPEARIVNVSSVANFRGKIDWARLERRTSPRRNGFQDYANTKLMNVIHAKELARRLGGTAITTSSLHPGAVASNIWRALPGPIQWILKRFMLTNEQGAETPLYCATAPELRGISGRYYTKCREMHPNPLADDPEIGRELWARSERAIQ
ncbi:MAG TPA: SDR family oxidoreductase [Gemmatimonadales bacterium]|nr:SDR family oxidoreductase [Gemmatimonadales bacterium]